MIDAVDAAARASGIHPGQKLTDARAICPELVIEPSDPAGDAAWLERIARWSQRWSPWSAVDGADGLLLDSTGAAHLFGGETALLAEMQRSFTAMGLTARTAMAPTIGGAWALARHAANNRIVVTPDTLDAALAPLPVAALRIAEDDALALKRLGFKSVGALARVPTRALARRFRTAKQGGVGALTRLGQARGTVEEVVAPLVAREVYRAQARVMDPVRHTAILAPILADLAGDLCAQLEVAHRGLRRLRFEAFRVDGHVAMLVAATAAPVREPVHVARLFAEQLETLEAGFGFDAFALTALWHEVMDAQQASLTESEPEGLSLPHLIDRLCARTGAHGVLRPAPHASHIPERAITWHPALEAIEGNAALDTSLAATLGTLPERPVRLFDRPEQIAVIYATPEGPPRRFRWRRRLHDVIRVEGPERIAPEWWREKSAVRLRDYYRIEDAEGRRYWIYRNGVVDDGRGGPPAWFMHGLFA